MAVPERNTTSDLRQSIRQQFRRKAFRVLARFSLDDFLAALTPARLTSHADDPDLRHLNRYALYQTAQYAGDQRREFVEELVQEATNAATRITATTIRDVEQVLADLERRDKRAVGDLRQIAADNVRSYFRDDEERYRDMVRMLIALSDPSNEANRAHRNALLHYYKTTTAMLSAMYGSVLQVLGRQPIDRLGDDTEDLALVLMALADGLVLRALIDPAFRADRYFADVIVPIAMALTTPSDHPEDVPDVKRVWPDAK